MALSGTARGIRSLAAVAAALAALGGTACSGGAAVHLPPPSNRTELVAVDEAHPTHFIGVERILADVTILGLGAGSMQMQLEQVCQSGRPQLEMKTSMRTTGVVRLFARRDGEAATRIDTQTATPKVTAIWMDDGSIMRRYQVRYAPGVFAFTYEKSDGPTKQGVDPVPGEERAHDLQSAVVLLRSWRPKKGAQGYFHVVLGYRVWRADVVYRGSETIEVAGGTRRRAVRIDGLAHKLLKKPKDDDKPRRFSLFFSDDAERAPLRITGEAKFGTVQFDLTGHDVQPTAVVDCSRTLQATRQADHQATEQQHSD